MKMMTTIRTWQASAAALALMMAAGAQAQYVWVDAKGVKQYSDRGPPPEVPTKNILKSPVPLNASFDGADDAGPAKAPARPPEPSLADKEAEHRKRMTAKAEADKEAAKKAGFEAQRTAACNAARAARAQLGHGRRLRSADGSIMDDAQRASEAARTDAMLRDCAGE